MFVTEPVVEGETGKTADKQRAGVDKMSNEVERLRHVGLFFGQNILDILNMSSGTEVDKDHTKRDEGNLKYLKIISHVLRDGRSAPGRKNDYLSANRYREGPLP